MNRIMLTAVAAAAFACAVPPALAQAAGEADVETRLEAARQRLEAAAREVAELAVEAGGPHAAGLFEMQLPSPQRAMLGINLGATEAGGGVSVNGVSPGGPAAEAGVRAGDRIVRIDGKPVATGRDLVSAMRGIEAGQQVALELQRDGRPVRVTVAARPIDRLFLGGPGMAVAALPGMHALPAIPPMQGMALAHARHWLLEGWHDAELVTVTPALGRYFGADKGVLVARAPTDAALGLQDGDVIVDIGGREPQSGPHAMRILRSYQPGEAVELRILRDRKPQTLRATIPESALGHAPLDPVAPLRPPEPPRPPASPT